MHMRDNYVKSERSAQIKGGEIEIAWEVIILCTQCIIVRKITGGQLQKERN